LATLSPAGRSLVFVFYEADIVERLATRIVRLDNGPLVTAAEAC